MPRRTLRSHCYECPPLLSSFTHIDALSTQIYGEASPFVESILSIKQCRLMFCDPGHTMRTLSLFVGYSQQHQIPVQCVPSFFGHASQVKQARQLFRGHALHIDSSATIDVAIADLAAKWVYRPVLCLYWYHIHMRKQEQRAL